MNIIKLPNGFTLKINNICITGPVLESDAIAWLGTCK